MRDGASGIELRQCNRLTAEEGRGRAGKNLKVRVVGVEDEVERELTVELPEPNDLYMACSDGLSEMVEDWILQNILIGQQDNLEDCAQALIRAANQNGGNDNISVVLVRFLPA